MIETFKILTGKYDRAAIPVMHRGAGRVSGQGEQNSARSAEKKHLVCPPWFSICPPCQLPYVTVAHPAHRTEADLREKASLATNQEGSLPPLPSLSPSV